MRIRFLAVAWATGSAVACAGVVEVKDAAALKAALAVLKPATTLKIAPGDYPGGWSVSGIGDLTVEAADAERPPHFHGGSNAWQFSRCPGLTLRHLRCSGQTQNGFNVDDGGKLDRPVTQVKLERLRVEDIGPVGNFDGIKCSGIDRMEIRDCEVAGWGGQAIDLVGCHQVLITGCTFTGKEGFSQHTGPQFKGGCEDIRLEKCRLIHAGPRPIQAGGSTGMDFFRPPGAKYEARRISISGNLIEGGECAAAFTGVDGVEFRDNRILFPEKWIFRILQETRAEGFPPCGHAVVAGNSIVFRRGDLKEALNIGEGTAPETFLFEKNRWFAEDRPEQSRLKLPVEEVGGIYGVDPR